MDKEKYNKILGVINQKIQNLLNANVKDLILGKRYEHTMRCNYIKGIAFVRDLIKKYNR